MSNDLKISPSLKYYRKNSEVIKAKMLERHHAKKQERNAYCREYSKNNPEVLQLCYERSKAKRYGLTVEKMREVLKGTTCEICGTTFTNSLHKHIDHCHFTGKFRGLLCSKCNLALGHVKDSIDILKKAITYLEKSNE